MKLVIVESPAKAKTIGRFLGPEYRVEASYGHIRDLPRSAKETPSAIREKSWGRLGVDTQNGFRPVYVVPDESRRHVRELTKLLRQADEILLATDEDREGESISWHLIEVLKPSVPVRRIAFHEITKPAIQEALANPREVDRRLVQAQEARRVLDRLYGYELSPVLWKKVRTKLSAGRVQSVALRLVVDREEERRRFMVSEYWRAKAVLASGGEEFAALLVTAGGKRVAVGRDFDSATGELLESSRALHLDREAASRIAAAAVEAAPWRVGSVERKSARQKPASPFTTSTLQQAASSRLRLSPRQTMRSAQRLYEGIDLGGGDREGLITYMRTDSVTLSSKALGDAGRYIRRVFGDEYYGGPRRYRTKSKIAQEAHEGIRPTEIGRTPDQLARFLDRDELALYRLIWSRTVASQMADAQVDRSNVDLIARIEDVDHVFRATGSVLRFPGYLKVYGDKRKDQLLPALYEGDSVHAEGQLPGGAGVRTRVDADRPLTVIRSVKPDPRETTAPPRYSEASLVKKLEEEAIGRPSTYTPTISTIQDRDYVRKRGGTLVPTYIGMAVIQLLREHFGTYIDLGFTARMEDSLDDIAAGEADSRRFLDSFYNGEGDRPGLVRQIEDALPGIDFPKVPVGTDPETGKPIWVRIGKTSVFAERGEGDGAERATIPVELLIDELTVERASELLKTGSGGGEHLGDDPETGLPVFVRVGPFGPYVQLGETRKGREKPRWVGLPKGMEVPDVTLDHALRFLSLPRTLGTDPENGEEVKAGLGKYGPFVVRAREYRSLESADQVFSVTLDEALSLLAQPKARRRGRKVLKAVGIHPETGAEIQLLEGRYGPYVTDGTANASVPKGRDPAATTVDEAVELLANAARRKKGRAPRGRRKASTRTAGKR